MDNSDDAIDDALSSGDERNNWIAVAVLLAVHSQRQPRIPSNRIFLGQEYVDKYRSIKSCSSKND